MKGYNEGRNKLNTTKEYIYTKEDMIRLDNDKNIHYFPLVKDFVIKNIFSKNPELLKNFLILPTLQ